MGNAFLARQQEKLDAAYHQGMLDGADRMLWLSIVTCNNVFGAGEKGIERYLTNLQAVADEFSDTYDIDPDLAIERLRRRCEKIMGCSVKRVEVNKGRKKHG
ncbi:MAG: hypothetical protein J6S14_14835 [Clostridia bacterium]|nr:hypothetical protein [Clostridia bacterium]